MKKNNLIISLLTLVTMEAMGQNSSYNANTVPIGGTSSAALGVGALGVNTGSDNTAVGRNAIKSNTSGADNTAVGSSALQANTTGNSNTAFGSGALYSNTTGSNNIANGFFALSSNTTGSQNVAHGNFALYSNTTGNNNTANGQGALQSNINGSLNVAIGRSALYSNTTGWQNTANGNLSLFFNTTGGNNTANGFQALYFNTTGSNNTASGIQALYSNTTGLNNTANGISALYFNTEGSQNSANGVFALNSNTTGFNNTANGNYSLQTNKTGANNIAIGYGAGASNTTQSDQLFINSIYRSGYLEDTTQSIIYGQMAQAFSAQRLKINAKLQVNDGTQSEGYVFTSNATGIGHWSPLKVGNTSGNSIAVGDSAGFVSAGTGNIFLGNKAGYFETGNNKMYMGNDSNKTIIYGDLAKGQLLLGKQKPTGYSFIGNRTLNVLGGVLTDSVRISPSSNWADFVFADDYLLKPINELEEFIKTNKHLPNIPSAKEVAANGIELGLMNSKLLEKIEELTLYIMQQQKKIELQEKNYSSLSEQLNEQQKQINTLKNNN